MLPKHTAATRGCPRGTGSDRRTASGRRIRQRGRIPPCRRWRPRPSLPLRRRPGWPIPWGWHSRSSHPRPRPGCRRCRDRRLSALRGSTRRPLLVRASTRRLSLVRASTRRLLLVRASIRRLSLVRGSFHRGPFHLLPPTRGTGFGTTRHPATDRRGSTRSGVRACTVLAGLTPVAMLATGVGRSVTEEALTRPDTVLPDMGTGGIPLASRGAPRTRPAGRGATAGRT